MRFKPQGLALGALHDLLDNFKAEDFRNLRAFAFNSGLSLHETIECLWTEGRKHRAVRD